MPTQPSKQKKWLTTLKFLAAYLVAAWTFLQFVDWALNRYSISPYWVDLLLWIFVGIIPSLLIYFYNQDRINKLILKKREKIIFPLNILLIMGVTYIGFGNSDLGATTKSIDYETESGEKRSALITKEEFRTGFYVFPFKPKEVDSSKQWLQFGINYLLVEDLLQNKNLSPEVANANNTQDKVRGAGYFNDYYVDGEFEIKDSTYILTAFIRKSKTAKIINQQTFKGTDVLNIIDDISVFVTDNFTSKEFNRPKYLDINVKEFTSTSLKAIEYFIEKDYTNAVFEDETFALAYLENGKRNLTFNQGKYEERLLADNAYKYRSRLPLQKQGEALILKNLAYDEYNNAEQLVKLQLEVNPSDDTYNRILYNIYGRTKNLKAYTQRAYDAWANKKSVNNGALLIEAALIREDYDYILKQIDLVSLADLNDETVFHLKLRPLILKGDIEEAQKIHDKFKLLHPDLEKMTKVNDIALSYLKNNKPTDEKLQRFEGFYRSNNSEQTYTIWVENNTLLHYTSNQSIMPYILAGDNIIVRGTASSGKTVLKKFYPDEIGEFYIFEHFEYRKDRNYKDWSWKMDDSILQSERLLESNQLDSAKVAYEKAIETNPKHYYLKDALAYINYVKSIDSTALFKQLNEVVGTYGPRKFWMEDGKLFYKRQQMENGRVFPKIELLPISENRYMNLTKIGDHFAFELYNGKPTKSFIYQYSIEDEEWRKSELEGNTFNRSD
ncbi:hypothetical protein [Winogradskyella vincentii]|uniref:Tetratricopeptide repeat-containing protein n=1 Tax=Winogradskyella vincentii TaxID=2877122 RepID=A0ABS7XYX2_9FLAO|nr:hypothetical protein [Winogradskyella vincentii]MCA0152846.1 hypothetical protein [Winogradskyella vincentii]